MITVKKDHHAPPAILTSPSCLEKIKELIESSTRQFSHHYYAHETVQKSLYTFYYNKCAYCESLLGVTSYLNIEHYRPKGGVNGEPLHPGYYWLAYEWSNLLPACAHCNNAKSSYFPIHKTGKRVIEPIHENGKLDANDCLPNSRRLKGENPLLLHPEIDEPEKHIEFLAKGEVKGTTEQGEKTIEICDLNRKGLVLLRKTVIDSVIWEIEDNLEILIEDKQKWRESEEVLMIFMERWFHKLFKRILDKIEPCQPYSLLAWFMFKDFNVFFIEPLSEEIKEEKLLAVVRKAYETFIERHE